ELNTSHSYIAGGDFDLPERPRVALPGARFELDRGAGRYKIAKIFEGDNAEELYRSPLTQIGVDGVELAGDDNPYRLLRGKASQPVELTLNGKPTLAGARKVVFRPIESEEK